MMNNEKKDGRGGWRGGGRPKKDNVGIYIKVSKDISNEISQLSEDLGITKGQVVELAIKILKESED